MLLVCTFSELIKEVLKLDGQIKKLAEELVKEKSILLMGRGFNHATCLEGALVSVLLKAVTQTSPISEGHD